MDGSQGRAGGAVDVEGRLREIKAHMPKTYRAIQDKATEVGREAYALVRRSIAGQPSAFYAMEGGRVVGTPFNLPDITADVAKQMVGFGCGFMVMWARPAAQEGAGAADGAK